MSKRLAKEELVAIKRSGYLMEQRLVPLVQRLGYYTIPNYSFKDPETGEARELDIYAMGAERISVRRIREFIFPVLLIECKNLRAPLVFFTQSEIRSRHLMGDVHISGLPKEVIMGGVRDHISDYLRFEDFHHYYQKGRISSQFCVVAKNKKGTLTAGHDLEGIANLYHSIILPLIKAVGCEIDEHEKSWNYVPGKEIVNLQFYYPIVITKGELYECFVGGKQPQYKRVHRISFIRRYHSEKMDGEYRIDVVTETGFRRLLTTIESEIASIAKKIRRKKEFLRSSANAIAREKKKEASKAQRGAKR